MKQKIRNKCTEKHNWWGRNDWARPMGWVELYICLYINHTRGKLIYRYTLIRWFSPNLQLYSYDPMRSLRSCTLPPNSDVDIKKIHYHDRHAMQGRFTKIYYTNCETEGLRGSKNDGGLTSMWGRGPIGKGRQDTSTRKIIILHYKSLQERETFEKHFAAELGYSL